MSGTLAQGIWWSERLLALSILVQTVELIQLREWFSDRGVWRWSTLRREFASLPTPILRLLDTLLDTTPFSILLLLRVLCAAVLLVLSSPWAILGLLVTTFLVSVRWRGAFNGGSDAMTFVTLLGLGIAQFPGELAPLCGVFFIASQVVLSYFIAGVCKVGDSNWRKGTALPLVFASPQLVGMGSDGGARFPARVSAPLSSLAAHWAVIILELAAPLLLAGPSFCAVLLSLFLAFHVFNAYLLGLNRFLLAWLAAYPSVFAASVVIASVS